MRLGDEGQYVVEHLLGDGATGRVLACRDPEQALVAVKVAKATRRQRRHAEGEAAVLRELEELDRATCHRVFVRLLGTFLHDEEHFCLAFEPLPLSLRALLQGAGGRPCGLLIGDIRTIAWQLLNALQFLHSAGLAHTDIKCTNVMLRDGAFDLVHHPRADRGALAARPRRPVEAVLIDFGCAVRPAARGGAGGKESSGHGAGGRPGARHIRAPELVLGLPDWDLKIDMWSFGCLLSTCYTGNRLFPVHADAEHLAAMERACQAPIPREMGEKVSSRIAAKGVSFDEATGRLDWPGPAAGTDVERRVRRMETLRESVLPRHAAFLDLLQGLLEFRPGSRLSAEAALQMPFFTNGEAVE